MFRFGHKTFDRSIHDRVDIRSMVLGAGGKAAQHHH
jgi:hypothetical protein